jgi:ribosomal protein S18 acetylase RimI-like enzyme
MKRLLRASGFGKSYTDDLKEKVTKQQGIIYLAVLGGNIVGCVACTVLEQSKLDRMGCVATKAGRIVELVVDPAYRRQGVGSRLIQQAEVFLVEKGCDVIRVEVFAPNTIAHDFYTELGYADRVVDMVKPIEAAGHRPR